MTLLKVMELLKKIFKTIHRYWVQRNSEAYLNYLRKSGFKIGDNTYFHSPKTFRIDLTRPSLITIGSDCRFNLHDSIIAHDVVSRVFIKKYNDFLPSEGRITIGNNVIFGSDVTVLKGVTIGDNCIIGLGSVVTRDIPSNSVAIGTPARVVCSLDEFYEKRKKVSLAESFEYARSIVERYGRRPVPADFWDSFVWFVNGENMDLYPEIPFKHQLGSSYEYYRKHHVAKYATFDEFLKAAGID